MGGGVFRKGLGASVGLLKACLQPLRDEGPRHPYSSAFGERVLGYLLLAAEGDELNVSSLWNEGKKVVKVGLVVVARVGRAG